MTDIPIVPPSVEPTRHLDLKSDAARARVRARYRAERRFRYYGIAALSVTTVFLVVLLVDILVRGLPAFQQHSLVFEVPVKEDVIDPAGKREIPRAGRAARRQLRAARGPQETPGAAGRGSVT